MKAQRIIATGDADFTRRDVTKRLVGQGSSIRVAENPWRDNLDDFVQPDSPPVIDMRRDPIPTPNLGIAMLASMSRHR